MTNLNIVNPKHVAYVGSLRNSGDESGDAWFTPPEIIEKVRYILNGIELDPFSSEDANDFVVAKKYYSLKDSAFDHAWRARTVFMNPPYSRGICAKAIDKFLAELNKKNFATGVVLVNNMTDTQWFHNLAKASIRRCDFRGRISFKNTDNKRISGNTRGQCLLLCLSRNNGLSIARFDETMNNSGIIYERPLS